MMIVIIISLVENTLTASVLSRKRYRDNTTAVYLLSLAASDLTLNRMLNWLIMFNFINMTTFTCRLFLSWNDLGLFFTNSWIMYFVSIERVISVCLPHKVRLVCTINPARCTNVFLWLFCIVIFSLSSQTYFAYSDMLYC